MKHIFSLILILAAMQSPVFAEAELGPPITSEAPAEPQQEVAQTQQQPEQEPEPEEQKVIAVLYVTDNLILGMKDNPQGSGKNLKLLRSGTRLEVLERQGSFSKVRTDDGQVGWAKSTFMVKDKPAILWVKEIKAENEKLRKDIEALKQGKNITPEKIVEIKSDPAQKQKIAELELALDEAKKQLAERPEQAEEVRIVEVESGPERLSLKMMLIAMGAGLLTGAGLMFYYFNQRMRKRFAGMRV